MRILTSVLLLSIVLTTLACQSSPEPQPQSNVQPQPAKPTILFVLTSHDKLGQTDTKTGYYLSEVSHVWKPLVDAGYAVDFASIQGGKAPIDPKSMNTDDKANAAILARASAQLSNTKPLAQVDPSRYIAVYYPGGHGTMWDLPGNEDVQRITRKVWESGGVVAAVCHGPSALVDVKLSDGTYLVAGKRVSAFTDAEERAVKLEDTVPFLLASKLQARGATLEKGDNFTSKIAVDGRLITGQNPASASALAKALLDALPNPTP